MEGEIFCGAVYFLLKSQRIYHSVQGIQWVSMPLAIIKSQRAGKDISDMNKTSLYLKKKT